MKTKVTQEDVRELSKSIGEGKDERLRNETDSIGQLRLGDSSQHAAFGVECIAEKRKINSVYY